MFHAKKPWGALVLALTLTITLIFAGCNGGGTVTPSDTPSEGGQPPVGESTGPGGSPDTELTGSPSWWSETEETDSQDPQGDNNAEPGDKNTAGGSKSTAGGNKTPSGGNKSTSGGNKTPNGSSTTAGKTAATTARTTVATQAPTAGGSTSNEVLPSVKDTASIMNPQPAAPAEVENAAKALKDKILNSKDSLTVTGTKYYVSNSGDNLNDGKSPATAWKTVEKVNMANLKAGDAVLFERGSIFRISAPINTVSGVAYGAYGTGNKPTFYGSLQNEANFQWVKSGDNIYYRENFYTGVDQDVGCIVFNHGEAVGVRKNALKDLASDLDFYHDWNAGRVYVYSAKGDPSARYKSIEMARRTFGVRFGNVSDVRIDNLCFKYIGGHAISSTDNVSNISITNCEVGWVGGSLIALNNGRFGNGLEFWANASNCLVKNNYFYQIYDSAMTNQWGGSTTAPVVQEKISYIDNLVEYTTTAYEYFSYNNNTAVRNITRDINVEGNIMRYSGMGWGSQRPQASQVAPIVSYSGLSRAAVSNYTIKNNIMDRSSYIMVKIDEDKAEYLPVLSGNTYVGGAYISAGGKSASSSLYGFWDDLDKVRKLSETVINSVETGSKLLTVQ